MQYVKSLICSATSTAEVENRWLGRNDTCVDESIYSRNRQFRLVYNWKLNSNSRLQRYDVDINNGCGLMSNGSVNMLEAQNQLRELGLTDFKRLLVCPDLVLAMYVHVHM